MGWRYYFVSHLVTGITDAVGVMRLSMETYLDMETIYLEEGFKQFSEIPMYSACNRITRDTEEPRREVYLGNRGIRGLSNRGNDQQC